MYVMAGLLVVGFICNACIRAVDQRYYMKPEGVDQAFPAFGGK
jgi:hypothetical protein